MATSPMSSRAFLFILLTTAASLCVAQTPKRVSWDYKTVPITIEVGQDVPIKRCGFERGALCADANIVILKGDRFRMLEIGTEGSCVIEYDGSRYEPSSCPWLLGSRDSQARIFVIVDVAGGEANEPDVAQSR